MPKLAERFEKAESTSWPMPVPPDQLSHERVASGGWGFGHPAARVVPAVKKATREQGGILFRQQEAVGKTSGLRVCFETQSQKPVAWKDLKNQKVDTSKSDEKVRLVLMALGREQMSVPIDGRDVIRRQVQEFLADVYELSGSGNRQSATDRVFDYIDRLCVAGLFEVCNEILKHVQLNKVSTALMRSFLTITYPARDKIEERKAFFERVEKAMTERRGKEVAERLLRWQS